MAISKVRLIECPRDAMQGWKDNISTSRKAEYINQLLKVGFDTIDFGSFVSAKAIPQMADTRAVLTQALPDAEPLELDDLARIAAGAPGDAIRFAGLDISGLDAAIDRLAVHGDTSNALRVALGKTLGAKAAQARYEVFLERAPARIAVAARTRPPHALAETVALWRQARDIADRAVHQSLDPQTTVFEISGLVAKLAPLA